MSTNKVNDNQFSYDGTQEFLLNCAREFIQSFRGRDEFILPSSDSGIIYEQVPYPHTGVLSVKQNIVYELSRLYNEIFIKVEILFPEEIRFMPSSFWSSFIELDELGKLTFLLSECNNAIKSKINRKQSKCVIYDLVKEMVLLDEYDYINNNGYLTLTFELNKNNENLIQRIIKSINLLYKINYQLYRRNYLKVKKKS
ncbi:hypothetical protein KRX11_03770 [Pasteurellaceae bacterium TAE3-ERU1]|nr:hypothetical protein [Pasteurellaceae bacterium TAE3-ERU1]